MEALIARSVQILIALGGAYILTLWFAIVVWTFQDIQARSRSVVAQIFSTLVVLIFSIPGLLIYMILRPRYTLDDAFQRSLEEEYLMQDLEELPLCPGCQQYVEDDWVFCPNCRTELRDNCIACDQLIDLRWEICPFCGTEQYEEDDVMLPAPVIQPAMSPSPQFLGRPQMNQAEVLQLQGNEERTRPIIPATVRVDLRSGDVATERVPELPISAPLQSIGGLTAPRRVALGGNGNHLKSEEMPESMAVEIGDEFLENSRASTSADSHVDVADEPSSGNVGDPVFSAGSGPDSVPEPADDADGDTTDVSNVPEYVSQPKKRKRKRRTRRSTDRNS